VLSVVAGACWLPVVWLKIRMQRIAKQAVRHGSALPDDYARLLALWVLPGIPAFVALVVVFWLMIARSA
jgi:uncharacterized membrane protein